MWLLLCRRMGGCGSKMREKTGSAVNKLETATHLDIDRDGKVGGHATQYKPDGEPSPTDWLAEGAKATLVGIVNAPSMNGQLVSILDPVPDPENGKIRVQNVATGAELKVLPDQLEAVAAPVRSEVNSELNFSPNFEGLVLGCIDADFCK